MDVAGASHWLAQASAGAVELPDTGAAVVGAAVVGAAVVGAMSATKCGLKETELLTVGKGNL